MARLGLSINAGDAGETRNLQHKNIEIMAARQAQHHAQHAPGTACKCRLKTFDDSISIT